jgi:hypothetical protein
MTSLPLRGSDQSAAGFRGAVETQSPDVVLLGDTALVSSEELDIVVRDLRESHAEIPIVLGGPAAGGDVPHDRRGMTVLERMDESVEAVEDLLAARAMAASVQAPSL